MTYERLLSDTYCPRRATSNQHPIIFPVYQQLPPTHTDMQCTSTRRSPSKHTYICCREPPPWLCWGNTAQSRGVLYTLKYQSSLQSWMLCKIWFNTSKTAELLLLLLSSPYLSMYVPSPPPAFSTEWIKRWLHCSIWVCYCRVLKLSQLTQLEHE